MTQDKVDLASKKYKAVVPKGSFDDFKEHLKNATDECFESVMNMPTKSVVVTILLSIFLGLFAVDRFYIKDTELAVFKLAATVLGAGLLFLPGYLALGIIISIIAVVWWIADIFVTYRTAKKINFELLASILMMHKEEV